MDSIFIIYLKVKLRYNVGMKAITKFTTKKGREVEIWEPSMERLDSLLEFVNRLVEDDTFLTLTGKPKTRREEEEWLKENLAYFNKDEGYMVWAVYKDKIIGQCDFRRGGTRDWHTCTIGLMIDRDFRGEGIGRFLFEHDLEKAKKMPGLKIVKLYVFDDNEIAKKLYEKLGFKEFARLPKGFFRQGKYTDGLQMYKVLND